MEESMLSKPEYVERSGNVYLTLRNKVSNHTKTIPDAIIKHIQDNWSNYNDTQRKILQYLLYHNKATIEEFAEFTDINPKTIRIYLNQFIDDENIVARLSKKIRDKNAKYAFRKN